MRGVLNIGTLWGSISLPPLSKPENFSLVSAGQALQNKGVHRLCATLFAFGFLQSDSIVIQLSIVSQHVVVTLPSGEAETAK